MKRLSLRRLAVLPIRLYQWTLSPRASTFLPLPSHLFSLCHRGCADPRHFQGQLARPAAASFVVTPGLRDAMIPYLPHILPLSAIRSNWIIMDDKRTFLAIALAIAVLLAWTPLAEHMGWIQPQQRPAATQEATPAPAPAAQTAVAPASSLPVFTPSAGTDVKVETPLYSAVIYSGGGILRSFTLKHYDETIKADSPKVNLISPEASQTAPLGLTVNGQPSWSTGQWSFQGSDLNLKAGEQGSLTFTGIVDGVRVTRVISFNADNYLLSENILVGSADQAPRTVRLGFTVAATPFSNGKYDPHPPRVGRQRKLQGRNERQHARRKGHHRTGRLQLGWRHEQLLHERHRPRRSQQPDPQGPRAGRRVAPRARTPRSAHAFQRRRSARGRELGGSAPRTAPCWPRLPITCRRP